MKKGLATGIIAVLAVLAIVFGILFGTNSAKVGSLTGEKDELAAQIETLTADAADKAAQIEALTADAADKAAQIETLTAADADKAAQIETLNTDVADKAAQIENITVAAWDSTSQIETLTADVADKAAQIETLTADVADKAAQIETLTADVADKAAQIEAKDAEIADLNTKVTELGAEIETLKATPAAAEDPAPAAVEEPAPEAVTVPEEPVPNPEDVEIGVQDIALGSTGFSIAVSSDYTAGKITAADTDESQVAYYLSAGSTLDFDVYQWAKAEGETLEGIAAEEAAQYGATVETAEFNGIPVFFYKAEEEYEGVKYPTASYLMENGDFIAEIVFWLDGENAEQEAADVMGTLIVVAEAKIDEGGTEIVLGTSNLKIATPVAYKLAEITAEDTNENQVGYYTSDESLIDFDVYQWAKAENETAEGVAAEEAAEYGAEETFEGTSESGIVFEGYWAEEEFEGTTYKTLTVITEDGNDFVEIVFWADGENAELVITEILATLSAK